MRNTARAIDLSRRIDELSLQRARVVADIDSEREYEAAGYPNTLAFLRSACNLGTAAAFEVLHIARQLHSLPAVESAVEQGQIGFQQAAVIAESADLLSGRQDEIVARAAELDPSRLRLEVKRVALQVDAERARREAEWAYRSRRLRLSTMSDGRVRLDGVLDAEGGAVVKTALNAALGARAKEETRSEDQRRADGLVDVAKRVLEGKKLGETGCQRPHVNISVQLETLLGLNDEPAQLDGAGPVVLEMVQRYLCDASVSMVALLKGEVVMAGAERRTFSPQLRRALTLKGRHCQHRGCDRPVEWCEGHHLWRWFLGGETTVANGSLLCGFHHRQAHSPPAAA